MCREVGGRFNTGNEFNGWWENRDASGVGRHPSSYQHWKGGAGVTRAQKPGQVEEAKPHPGLPSRSYTRKTAAWGSRSHREESTLLLERPPKAKRKGDKHPGLSIPSALPPPSGGLHWLNSDGSQLIQEPRNAGHKGCYPCDEQCNIEQRKVKEWL